MDQAEAIRRFKPLIVGWREKAFSLATEYKGILLAHNHAYITDGAFLAKIRLQDEYRKAPHFLNISSGELQKIEELPYTLRHLKRLFYDWREHVIKLRKVDLLETAQKHFPKPREQRETVLKATVHKKLLLLTFYQQKEPVAEDFLEIWDFAGKYRSYGKLTFCLDLSYLVRALESMQEYHVVDICVEDSEDVPVLVKGVAEGKPDIRFCIAQVRGYEE